MAKSVIVIDDDEDTVRLFSEFLEENDIKVIGNGFDGVTAVKLFKETKPDVVLIDLNMPLMAVDFMLLKKFKELIPKQKLLQLQQMEVTLLRKN